MFKYAIPVLHVSNMAAAEDFYCRELRFRTEFEVPEPTRRDPSYMGIVRDAASLHLSSHSGDGVIGGVAYLLVESVDRLHEELLRNGVRIHLEPTDQTWGMREMYVRDPDGNSIRFGSPIAD